MPVSDERELDKAVQRCEAAAKESTEAREALHELALQLAPFPVEAKVEVSLAALGDDTWIAAVVHDVNYSTYSYSKGFEYVVKALGVDGRPASKGITVRPDFIREAS